MIDALNIASKQNAWLCLESGDPQNHGIIFGFPLNHLKVPTPKKTPTWQISMANLEASISHGVPVARKFLPSCSSKLNSWLPTGFHVKLRGISSCSHGKAQGFQLAASSFRRLQLRQTGVVVFETTFLGLVKTHEIPGIAQVPAARHQVEQPQRPFMPGPERSGFRRTKSPLYVWYIRCIYIYIHLENPEWRIKAFGLHYINFSRFHQKTPFPSTALNMVRQKTPLYRQKTLLCRGKTPPPVCSYIQKPKTQENCLQAKI